jgi:hypothetical protein
MKLHTFGLLDRWITGQHPNSTPGRLMEIHVADRVQ